MRTERIAQLRVVKTMETEAHKQRLVLIALIGGADDIEYLEKASDALSTVQTHIQALGHIVDKLTEKP